MAPVNVKLQTPTIEVPGWCEQASAWMDLNAAAHGMPDFYPLTVKAAYLVGVVHDICSSVNILLTNRNAWGTTYIPAFGVCASGVELLGRCIRGNSGTHGSTADLKIGLKWLKSSSYSSIQDCDTLITTSSDGYSIDNLAALRHFAAHGQAASNQGGDGKYQLKKIDFEILSKMPPLIADGLERYWNDLQESVDLCNTLAQANIIALRGWPVYKSWIMFEGDGLGNHPSITEIFNRFNWQI